MFEQTVTPEHRLNGSIYILCDVVLCKVARLPGYNYILRLSANVSSHSFCASRVYNILCEFICVSPYRIQYICDLRCDAHGTVDACI